jgi:Mg2+ and Co2+ transporter CorA
MALLSILLLPIILLPLLVNLQSSVLDLLEAGDVTIVAFFVAEYGSKLALAQSRWAYFRSPWHLVDLAVILLSVVSYLPFLGLHTAGSLLLLFRLLRLPRAFAIAGRTGASRVGSSETSAPLEAPTKETVIRAIAAGSSSEPQVITWEDLGRHLADGRPEWIDVSRVDAAGYRRLSELLAVPEPHFKSDVLDEIYPHATSVKEVSLMFLHSGKVQYPESSDEFFKVKRSGLIIIGRGHKVITVSPHALRLMAGVRANARRPSGESSFPVTMLFTILALLATERQSILNEIELEVTKVGSLPRSKLPPDFLARTYELNKEIARLSSNLIHIRQILTAITSGRIVLEGFDKSAQADFQLLLDETEFLNEIAVALGDRIQSLIDLYINQETFETNRILKILAVITSVAVIPAVVSGIFGQNLLGQPYGLELWQVVLAIGLSMSFVVYCFIKLGWLRT